jgi:hypothetical protein
MPGYPVSFDTCVQDTDASELCSTFYEPILVKSAEICLLSVWIQRSCTCSLLSFEVRFLLCPCADQAGLFFLDLEYNFLKPFSGDFLKAFLHEMKISDEG